MFPPSLLMVSMIFPPNSLSSGDEAARELDNGGRSHLRPCSQAVTVPCERCFGLLQNRRGRGLAKSTICWLACSFFLSFFLPPSFPLFFVIYILFIANAYQNRSHSQAVYTTRAVEQGALVKTTRLLSFFFQSIC